MSDAAFSRDGALVGAAGALTVGAGLVHAAAAGTHAGLGTAVALFTATAAVQVLLGIVVLVRPTRLAVLATAAVDAASAVAWAVSRTHGLPFLDGFRQREAVGLQDLTATLIEVAAVLAVGLALASRRPARFRRLSPVLAVAMIPALVGMAAPHDHDEAAHTHEEAASVGVAGGHTHGAASSLASDPIFAGGDTSHATTQQLQAAKRLIETTRASVAAKFPDEAALVAAGYRSIGDGLVTQYDHYIKADYMNDGRELDPEHIESIVMERTPSGWQIASAMYVLEPGKTMADVPDIAGDLTTWHDHDNLCWDSSGLRLAGILLNGKCFPGGTLRATPPMLHVWLADHECGPFAGIEGHGGACTHAHS